jgi:hypothetical protein
LNHLTLPVGTLDPSVTRYRVRHEGRGDDGGTRTALRTD